LLFVCYCGGKLKKGGGYKKIALNFFRRKRERLRQYERMKCIKSRNPLPPSDALRTEKKNILEDLFSSLLSQLKNYHPSGSPKFNNLGVFQSLKLHILMEKILSISLKSSAPQILSAGIG